MTQMNQGTIFCSDHQLSYKDCQTEISDGQGLLFDEPYRLAHLPLVAPDHPRVIQTKPGTSYNCGLHDPVYSVALPIHENQMDKSEEFKRLCDELRTSGFSHKLSWNTFSQRKNKLHATICGQKSIKDAPHVKQYVLEKLRHIGPVSIKVRGLFSGNINIGRLYLKVYPEQRDGKNMCHTIQQIFDAPLTDLYIVGLFNFIDELNIEEAQEFKKLLHLWQDVEFLQIEVEELWMLESRDDLVLDGGIAIKIPMT